MHLMTVICWNRLTEFVQETKIAFQIFFCAPETEIQGWIWVLKETSLPNQPWALACAPGCCRTFFFFFSERKDFCLLYAFASSASVLREHDAHVAALPGLRGVGLCTTWPLYAPPLDPWQSKPLGWGTRLCPSNGQRWKDQGGLCFSLPKRCVGIKIPAP